MHAGTMHAHKMLKWHTQHYMHMAAGRAAAQTADRHECLRHVTQCCLQCMGALPSARSTAQRRSPCPEAHALSGRPCLHAVYQLSCSPMQVCRTMGPRAPPTRGVGAPSIMLPHWHPPCHPAGAAAPPASALNQRRPAAPPVQGRSSSCAARQARPRRPRRRPAAARGRREPRVRCARRCRARRPAPPRCRP